MNDSTDTAPSWSAAALAELRDITAAMLADIEPAMLAEADR